MTETDGVDAILAQWRRERPDLDASPMGVIGRISRLSLEIDRRLDQVHAGYGLEPGWYDVLATLRRAGPPYRLRPADFVSTGNYVDEFRRTAEGWRISRRDYLPLGPGSVGIGSLPGAYAGVGGVNPDQ